MHPITFFLLFSLAGLQYKLWLGETSIKQWTQLEERLHLQRQSNESLSKENEALMADIQELKDGEQALEEQARYAFGMIKENETYYKILP